MATDTSMNECTYLCSYVSSCSRQFTNPSPTCCQAHVYIQKHGQHHFFCRAERKFTICNDDCKWNVSLVSRWACGACANLYGYPNPNTKSKNDNENNFIKAFRTKIVRQNKNDSNNHDNRNHNTNSSNTSKNINGRTEKETIWHGTKQHGDGGPETDRIVEIRNTLRR